MNHNNCVNFEEQVTNVRSQDTQVHDGTDRYGRLWRIIHRMFHPSRWWTTSGLMSGVDT